MDRHDPWRAQVITLYPEMFPGLLAHALAGRALAGGIWALDTIRLRDFARDRHRCVDDTPAGGGPGMVLKVDVLARAVDAARAALPDGPVIALTPRGPRATQARIRALASGPGVTLLCGRFEGFDERIFAGRAVEPLCVGDLVYSGGEVAAMAVIDACVRLLPGVMGAASSGTEESFETKLLEYPHYTRPAVWEGHAIPEVLTSGDHGKIAARRARQAAEDTTRWRPDLGDEASPSRTINRPHQKGQPARDAGPGKGVRSEE
jgi:tRNA (guanine37-N1)-methyltransferase